MRDRKPRPTPAPDDSVDSIRRGLSGSGCAGSGAMSSRYVIGRSASSLLCVPSPTLDRAMLSQVDHTAHDVQVGGRDTVTVSVEESSDEGLGHEREDRQHVGAH